MNIKKLVAVILLATAVGYTTYTTINWYNNTYRFNVFGCEFEPGNMNLIEVSSAEVGDGGFYVTHVNGVRAFIRPSAYYNCMLVQKD